MKTERDLGMMVTIDPKKENHPLRFLKLDAGIFNGPGLTSFADFDSHKDFIARMSLKPRVIGDFSFSGGISYFNGGLLQNSKYRYQVVLNNNVNAYRLDSSLSNIGRIAPRKYKGADIQIKWKVRQAFTEFRAEYWKGRQTSFAANSETPAFLSDQPYYIRNFDGAFFYFLQRLNRRDEVAIKFDWFDPNSRVKNDEITADFTPGDIEYSTIGFGYIGNLNSDLKVILWYDLIKNERTRLPGFTSDLEDNLFTFRLQFKF
jgi:hypothetical protein